MSRTGYPPRRISALLAVKSCKYTMDHYGILRGHGSVASVAAAGVKQDNRSSFCSMAKAKSSNLRQWHVVHVRQSSIGEHPDNNNSR